MKTEMYEFNFSHIEDDGVTVYHTPHEIWNTIEVRFPSDYFEGMKTPTDVYIGIEMTKPRRCINCDEQYSRAALCFDYCQRCIPDVVASTIKTVDDLKKFQRSCGADV